MKMTKVVPKCDILRDKKLYQSVTFLVRIYKLSDNLFCRTVLIYLCSVILSLNLPKEGFRRGVSVPQTLIFRGLHQNARFEMKRGLHQKSRKGGTLYFLVDFSRALKTQFCQTGSTIPRFLSILGKSAICEYIRVCALHFWSSFLHFSRCL